MKPGLLSAKVVMRAEWILNRQRDRMTLTYAEKVAEVREHFGCGKTAAEQAIRVAGEMLRDAHDVAKNPGLYGEVAQFYWDVAEDARAAGDFRAARAAMDSFRRHTGIGAPDRVEHSGKVTHNMTELSDAELEILAKLDRAAESPAETAAAVSWSDPAAAGEGEDAVPPKPSRRKPPPRPRPKRARTAVVQDGADPAEPTADPVTDNE